MLAPCSDDVSRSLWPRLAERTQLPCSEAEFLAVDGTALASGHSRRQYHRYHLRRPAILRGAGDTAAVYSKDVSRMGLGLLTPRQLFPSDEIELLLPDQPWVKLIVRRCRRLQPCCYEVGAEFAEGILNAGRYKNLIHIPR